MYQMGAMSHSLSVCQRLITLILRQTAIVAAQPPLIELWGEVWDRRGDLIAGANAISTKLRRSTGSE
jgi:hypothetical protein